jgi:hypothetical protein
MKIANHVLKKLPKVVGNDEEMRQMEYVHSVLGGKEKPDALKEHFPELHELALERANGNAKVVNANIKSQITNLERKGTVKKMYELAHKHAWTNFLDKKHKLYENLYTMATDKENSVRDRVSSSKTLLDHMPKFEEDTTIVVEVKDGKAEFVDRLRDMQLALHKQANKDVIEGELDE